jgi:CIC family chloride channel protein
MSSVRAPSFPVIAFLEGTRGYELRVGAFRIPQSTYLVAAAVIIGLGGGWGAVAFRALIGYETVIATWLTALFGHVLGRFGLIPSIAIGGALAAWITARFAPEARGHGVPEVMAAVALRGGVMRPRIILIKALASATTIGFGGAAGREGPIVQIGSTIGSVLGQITHAPAPIVRTLVACGAAAGISATFNAPIGGVFFASEVILGDFTPRAFSAIVVSSVVSAIVGRAVLGDRPSFIASGFTLVSPRELWLYALLGVICAVWATGFVKLLYFFEDAVDRIKLPQTLKGLLGFALVGAIGVGVPQILGVGYEVMQSVLYSHVDFTRAFGLAVLKPIATSLTLAAGGSGGVFAPSLFTGAMLGDAFGRIVHGIFPAWTATPAAYGLVAMAALFAAAAEAPITAIVIVFEMSDDYTIILPLMIATVIATIIGKRLLGSTVYEMKLERRGIDWNAVRRPHALAQVRVESVIDESPSPSAEATDTVAATALRYPEVTDGIAVVEAGRFVGIVSAIDLARAAATTPDAPVGSFARASETMLRAGDTLASAADFFADPTIAILPIVGDDATFVGTVTRFDVLTAYRSARAV